MERAGDVIVTKRDEKGPALGPGPNSLQGVRCLGPLTRPLLSIPVIMHAVNKSTHRRRRNVRVLEGALFGRSVPKPCVLTFANGERRLTVERVSIFHGEHQLILPTILFRPCVSRRFFPPPEILPSRRL